MGLLDKQVLLIIFAPLLAPRHVLMLKSLKARGWQISVIAWDRKGNAASPKEYNDIIDRWIWIHLPVKDWGFKLIPKLPHFYARVWQAYKSLGKPQVSILTHIFLLPLVFILSGTKIYDAYEMYALEMSFYFGAHAQKVLPFWQTLEGLLVKKFDGVYTLDSRQSWLENFYKKWNDRVQVIWNVPSKIDEPDLGEVNSLRDEFFGKKVITYVGGLARDKGLRAALEVAALAKQKHPDALFLFIGSMQDDPDEINSLVQRFELENNTRFINWLPYRKMLAYLAHSLIGIALHQPGRNYQYVSCGTGRKFITYMQAGIPIIAPTLGEIGLIVQKEGCGILVDTTNNFQVANTITYLLDHPGEADLMGNKGRKAFLEKYCWELEEQKFLNFYYDLLNNKKHLHG
ncbi:glycosyltransferase [Desulfobacca acetoxidans]|uniref:Glycosyl transferase group 1 n=1 Tax=Desulfobacca acetoxidans (strain ATCC 700848 / DSM 11109 / ASRB2) TaxID=880072 RepID=F2NIK2_DESAR|nr:glycosyltransferase [Desulfobacca acetoxidans]AEB10477.1 glycosyl transferase group 1 [Desulfobacca acetoxidans DSM 11109]